MSIQNNELPQNPSIESETVRPFRRFCTTIMTIGSLPSSYQEAMSYQEMLLWLCDFIENTVIPAFDNNANAITELQNLYVELKDYVDNYFTNLDVQEEINNKLDEMAENGTLTNLIANYVNPFIEQQNNNINNKFNEQNININNKFNEQNQIINNQNININNKFNEQDQILNTQNLLISNQTQNINSIQSQISNLVANPGSTTENNSELIDLRTNAFAKIFTTAGERTRSFEKSFFTKIEENTDELEVLENQFIDYNFNLIQNSYYNIYKLKTKPNTLYYISTLAGGSAPNLTYSYNNKYFSYPEGEISEEYKQDIVIFGTGATIFINNKISNTTYFIGKIINNNNNFENNFHDFTDYEEIQNKYINFLGNIADLSGFKYYKFTPKKGKIYLISSIAKGPAPLIYQRSNYTIPNIQNNQGIYSGEYIYFPSQLLDDIYINLSNSNIPISIKESDFTLNFNNDYLDNNFHDFTDYEKVENKYINFLGNISELQSYDYYKFIPKKNKIYLISSIAQGAAPLIYQKTNYSVPSNSSENDTYMGKYIYFPSQNLNEIYINFNKNNNYNIKVSIKESDFTLNLANNEENNFNYTNGCTKNLICIGDSLTEGVTYISQNNSYVNYFNYPYFLNKFINAELTNISKGGMTAKSWWETYNELITKDNSLYIVWLGTNSNITEDTVDIDCAGDNYENYTETETGYLGKILGKINSLPNNKICILNIFATVGNLYVTNDVLAKFAKKFNALLIDIKNTNYNNENFHTAYNGNYNGIHFNNVGNSYIANVVNNAINEEIKNNPLFLNFYIQDE